MKDSTPDIAEPFEAPPGFLLQPTGLHAWTGRGRHLELVRICNWLRVTAEACDADGGQASLVLEFRATSGLLRRKVIARRALLGSGMAPFWDPAWRWSGISWQQGSISRIAGRRHVSS